MDTASHFSAACVDLLQTIKSSSLDSLTRHADHSARHFAKLTTSVDITRQTHLLDPYAEGFDRAARRLPLEPEPYLEPYALQKFRDGFNDWHASHRFALQRLAGQVPVGDNENDWKEHQKRQLI